MGQRVDLAEVRNFADDYYSYINNLIDQFSDVKSAINQINRMDSFKGSAANSAKESLHDFHMKLLQHFENLMVDLLDNIDNHIDTFLSQVDSSDRAIIQENYLKDKEKDIQEEYMDMADLSSDVNDIVRSVDDISSASAPDFSSILDDKHAASKAIVNLNNDLSSFSSTGKGRINQIENVLSEIKSLLSKTTKQSSNGKLASPNLFLKHSDAIQNALHGLSQSRSFYTGSKMISASQNGNIIGTVEHKDYRTGKSSYRLTTNQGGLEALGVRPDFRAQSDFNHLLPKNGSTWNETDLIRSKNNQTILKAANGDKWTNIGSKVKELHPEIQYFRDEINVKHVSKSIMKGAYDGAKDGFKDTITLFKKNQTLLKSSSKAFGVAGLGLSAYTNYNDALEDGLKGKDAYVRAGVDTTVDTVVSGGVQGALTVAGTVLFPIPGVGTMVGLAVGIFANALLNVKFGKNKKSLMDRVKGWFH